MNLEHTRSLCFLFLRDRFYINRSSLLTLKSYDSDFKWMFYRDKKLLFPYFKGNKVSTPREISFKDLKQIKNQNQLKKELEAHIKQVLQDISGYWVKLSPASQNRKLAAAKAFIGWLFENNYIDSDFRYLYRSPKVSGKVPDFLSVDEVLDILRVMEKNKNEKKKERDLCLFYLLYGGGLRVSEACRIKTRDMDWERGAIEIKGKGGKPRIICLPEKAFKHIRSFQKNQVYLFGDKPLSPRLAYRIVRKWGEKAGILKTVHPHALRHSFATHILTSGSDLRALQELLGHKTLTATQKYTHLDLHHLSKTLDKYHPLNRESQKEKSIKL